MAARKMTVLWMIVPITLFVMLGALFAVRSLFPDVREVSWNPMDRVISVDGVKIRYREYPDTERRDPRNRRPAIVLLHGFRGELDHWQPTMERLHGFRVIALDLVGFGGSDKPHISYDLDTQSRYLVQFLENIGVEKVVLVGISMGASLTAWTAAKVPEKVAGLIMIAPSGYPGTLYKEWPHSTFFKPGIVNRVLCVIACSKWYRKIFPSNLGVQTLTVTASYNCHPRLVARRRHNVVRIQPGIPEDYPAA